MRLIIQIPCLNEEKTLPRTLAELPRKIPGIDVIETLIIDDGSTDRTVEVARHLGVNHVVSFTTHRGLAEAFNAGLEKCLSLGADIIVNTDGDNQYRGADVAELVKPIVEGRADAVVGDRPVSSIVHFSGKKKIAHRMGSFFTRKLINIRVRDVTSGFRAFSREAALHLNILSEYSHTLESLIQLGNKKLNIISVPVHTNEKLRESRLMKNNLGFIYSQMSTLLRIYTAFRSLRAFTYIGIFVLGAGALGLARFFYFLAAGDGGGHVQSLMLSTTLTIMGFFVILIGLVADLININRKLVDISLHKIKKMELKLSAMDGERDRPVADLISINRELVDTALFEIKKMELKLSAMNRDEDRSH